DATSFAIGRKNLATLVRNARLNTTDVVEEHAIHVLKDTKCQIQTLFQIVRLLVSLLRLLPRWAY
ncbi:MAG: hypothetical protein ACK5PZ_20995, partial [Pirellula sp.]